MRTAYNTTESQSRLILASFFLLGILGSAQAASERTFSLEVHNVQIELVRIAAGEFLMGSTKGDPDEKPVHHVNIKKPFYMGKTHVTVGQFRAFVETTGYRTEADRGNWAAEYYNGFTIFPSRNRNWRRPGFKQSESHPVVCISWNDAMAFCRWLTKETGENYRLPSEAEWEFACRAGREGDYAQNPGRYGWHHDNAGDGTHPVARKEPNRWGLYDMQGNAWQWCLDLWHSSYKGAPNTAKPWLTEDYLPPAAIRRVLRGGAWCREAFELGPTYRYRGTPDFRSTGTGFRIVCSGEAVDSEPIFTNRDSSEEHGAATRERQDVPDYEGTVDVNGIEFEFVRIGPGEFTMGSNRDSYEKPMHRVRIATSFDIGRTEVTVRQFRAFVEATGYQTDAEKERWAWARIGGSDWHPKMFTCWWYLPFEQSDDDPATCLSWHDAMEFCKWLSDETGTDIRLPSASQWEYACRAGTKTGFAGDAERMAWHRENSGHRTQPVGQKQSNRWGLYDMHGNVWEWCLDMWHENYEGAPNDGSAWTDAKVFEPVMRGGSFINPTWWLRSANNMRNNPGNRFSYNQGLRLVRELASSIYHKTDDDLPRYTQVEVCAKAAQ